MKTVNIHIVKIDVYHEVQKVTEYVGQRAKDDDGAYERVRGTDADMELFEAYWSEAAGQALGMMKEFVQSASGITGEPSLPASLEVNMDVVLSMPDNYPSMLTASLQQSLTNYFINFILSRWFGVVNKDDAESYAGLAVNNLTDAQTKLYHRVGPTHEHAGVPSTPSVERVGDKYRVTLQWLRGELLHDIQHLAYVEGDMKSSEEEHTRHTVMEICEAHNICRVVRMLGLRFAECVEVCYPFSRKAVSDESLSFEADDVLRQPDRYVMTLLLPADFSQTTLTLLVEYIHEYLVCHVLADWFSITRSGGEEYWVARAEAADEKLQGSLSKRCGRVRRPLTPW